ncbi:MAG: exonuclease SbcCD subunit D [Miltoncostaeaceae bacterium]
MRLLHTGDWHIGKALYGITRHDECRAVLEEVAGLARDERVDAILVAGDLLDRRLVDPTSLGIALETLSRLAEVAPVVAVPGNHDDPDIWRHLSALLAPRGVVVVDAILPAERAVIDVETAGGRLHVAALPWPEPHRLPMAVGAERGAARTGYAQLVADLVRSYAGELRDRRRADGAPAVLLGHLMVDGSQTGAGERTLTMALTYCLPTATIPTDLDYIALGHIHRPQPLPGVSAPGRYCGSPLALDFSEDNHAKTVTVVDLGEPPREIPLRAGRRLVRVRGSLDDLPGLAAAHGDAWLRCEVLLEQPVPELAREVRALVPNALRIDPVYPLAPGDGRAAEAAAGDDADRGLADLSGHYDDWYAGAGRRLDPGVAAAFAAAVDAAGGDEHGGGGGERGEAG